MTNKFIYDPTAAQKSMDDRWERHEGLSGRIKKAIEQAVRDKTKEQIKWGSTPITPVEARAALAIAVVSFFGVEFFGHDEIEALGLTEEDCLLKCDVVQIEKFIEELRMAADPKRHFELYE